MRTEIRWSLAMGLLFVLVCVAWGACEAFAQSGPPYWQFSRGDEPLTGHPLTDGRWIWAFYGSPARAAELAARPGQQIGQYVTMATGTLPGEPLASDRLVLPGREWVCRLADGSPIRWTQPPGLPEYAFADLRLAPVRAWRACTMRERFAPPWTVLCIDECVGRNGSPWDRAHTAAGPSVGAVPRPIGLPAAIDAQLELLRELRRRPGCPPIVVNWPGHPDTFAADWARVIPLVDGLLDEQGFPRDVMTPARFRERFRAYRAALDAGKTVLITTHGDDRVDAGRLLFAVLALVGNPGETFLASPYATWPGRPTPPDLTVHPFYSWRDRLGTPLGPMQWRSDTFATRRYRTAAGYIALVWVNPTTGQCGAAFPGHDE